MVWRDIMKEITGAEEVWILLLPQWESAVASPCMLLSSMMKYNEIIGKNETTRAACITKTSVSIAWISCLAVMSQRAAYTFLDVKLHLFFCWAIRPTMVSSALVEGTFFCDSMMRWATIGFFHTWGMKPSGHLQYDSSIHLIPLSPWNMKHVWYIS